MIPSPRARHLLLAWIIVFTLAVGFAVYKNRQLGQQGKAAHNTLCVFKHDLEQRVQGSVDFLRKHPHGIDGITAGVIRNSIRNQQTTLTALKTLDCK